MAKHKKPKTHQQIYAGPTVCECGAILGIEEWTCGACGRDPLDDSESDFSDDFDDGEDAP